MVRVVDGLSFGVVHGVLLDVGRGGRYLDVAARWGVSFRTVRLLVDEYGFMCVHELKTRDGSLTLDDRIKISAGIERGDSFAVIGLAIGRPRQTVSAEVNRHGGREGYQARAADVAAGWSARRVRQRWFETRPDVWVVVQERLKKYWSPEQVANTLRREHPDDPYWWVSHEAIYQAIYVQAKGTLKTELVKHLRTKRDRRKPQTRAVSDQNRSAIPDMVLIADRPPEADDRSVPGHWEGDLIVGKANKSFIATLVERRSRFGILVKLDNKQADHVAQRLPEAVARLEDALMLTLTWDQGREMTDHKTFTMATDIDVYFCDPKSPWQRGSNENWNGLVRQYLPKGTDLSIHSQIDLDIIAASLNTRPRKTLDWATPAEVLYQNVTTTT